MNDKEMDFIKRCIRFELQIISLLDAEPSPRVIAAVFISILKREIKSQPNPKEACELIINSLKEMEYEVELPILQ